jgi:Ca2+/Na+ antiporter
MHFTQTTHHIALAILCIAALYVLLYAGVTGLLMCSAVTLLFAAFMDQFEVIVALSVLFAIFYLVYLKRYLRMNESFTNPNDAASIVSRIAMMEKKPTRHEPTGVFPSAVEGFEDIQPHAPKEGASSNSSSAPSNTANQIHPEEVKQVTSAIQDSDIKKDELKSATNTLFKTGQMPSEHTDGPKLDAGQTIINAMKSLDPSTIKGMTSNTKELFEAQQQLSGMMQNMLPIVKEGHALVNTLSGMFGGKL